VEKIGGKVFEESKNLASVYGKGISKKTVGWSKDWNWLKRGLRAKAYWNQ